MKKLKIRSHVDDGQRIWVATCWCGQKPKYSNSWPRVIYLANFHYQRRHSPVAATRGLEGMA